MGSFSTCKQSQLFRDYSSFKREKITPFRFVASQQKRTNILFSSHCYSLNSFSYDFIVFLESRFVCQNILLIAQGWAGENEKSCFLIYTLFLSNGSDGSYHIWKNNILSQPEYWSIQAYLIQRKQTSDRKCKSPFPSCWNYGLNLQQELSPRISWRRLTFTFLLCAEETKVCSAEGGK